MKETGFLNKESSMLENLRNIDVLEPFDDQELHIMLEMSKIRKYRKGEFILQEGRTDTWLYFLMVGKVKISKQGKEIAVLSQKGEIFGEMGAIDSFRRSASAQAVTDVACLATDMFYVEKLSGQQKSAFGYVFYRLMAEILSRRLRQTTEALIQSKSKINLKFW